MSNKIKVFILFVFLVLFGFIYLLVFDREYTLIIKNVEICNISDFYINISGKKDIIKITNKDYKDNNLYIHFKSLNKGKVYLDISGFHNNNVSTNVIYVHSFGIITVDDYLGTCTGYFIFPILVIIFISYLLYLIIKKYIRSIKNNLYQYSNVYLLSLIIYLVFIIIGQVQILFSYKGLYNGINIITSSLFNISNIIIPIFIIISIFISIYNFKLFIKEGFRIRNMLGIILGFLLIIGSLFPIGLSDLLQSSTFIDIHNESSIYMYIEEYIDLVIYSIISYLECLLLCTIIYNIYLMFYTPKYDKNYIIILGCKIMNDGKVTNLLKGRIDKAIEFRNKQLKDNNKDLVFIVSGGKGNDEVISEAESMNNYLLECGINKNNIIIEDKSTNTYENFKYSLNKIKDIDNSNIIFSTTNYHLFRSGVIGNKFSKNIEGIGSSTKFYYYINAFIREFIAILVNEIRIHINTVFVFLIINFIMVICMYLSNNI